MATSALKPTELEARLKEMRDMVDALDSREVVWHPPRDALRKASAQKLIRDAVAAQSRHYTRRSGHTDAAAINDAERNPISQSDGGATSAAIADSSVSLMSASAGQKGMTDSSSPTGATLASTVALRAAAVAAMDVDDWYDAGVVGATHVAPITTGVEEEDEQEEPAVVAPAGDFIVSEEDDDMVPPPQPTSASAAPGASTTVKLSQHAAAALAEARRLAAKAQRGANADDATATRQKQQTSGAPAAMTYDEFMASGAIVGRAPRIGEAVGGAMTRSEEDELLAQGYMVAGRGNPMAAKSFEQRQRAVHHLEAQKQRLELAAEEQRRRDVQSLETFRRVAKQPPPPAPGGA